MAKLKITAKDRQKVEKMAGLGIRHDGIALVMDMSDETLRKYFRRELDLGKVKTDTLVAQSLFEKAIGNGPQSVTAAIFWCKTRLGWKDPNAVVEVISKKEEQSWAAKRAGLGSEWGTDLVTTPSDALN
jgi:hypothetical protein